MTAGKRPRLMMRRTVSVASLGAGSDNEHHVPHQVIGFAVKAFSENSSTSMQVSVEEPVSCSSSPSSPASKPKPFSGLTLLSDSTNREMMPPTSPSSGLGILAALNNTNPGSGGSVTRSCVVAANCQPHSRKQKHKAVLEAEEATNFQSNSKYDRCILRPSFTTLGFLESCHLCKRDISHGRDIYMYRGDKAFCSAECRHQQILNDERMERREKCSSAALKQGTQQGRHQRSKVSATTPATKVSAAA